MLLPWTPPDHILGHCLQERAWFIDCCWGEKSYCKCVLCDKEIEEKLNTTARKNTLYSHTAVTSAEVSSTGRIQPQLSEAKAIFVPLDRD